MFKYVRPIIKDMVLFVDQLMIGLYPPFKKLNEAKRQKYILEFFRFAGLVKLKKGKRRGDIREFGDKLAEGLKRGRLGGRQNYESFVRNCVGPCGLRTDWFNFVNALVTIFSREHKFFFEWLRAEIKTIKLGRKILSSHGLTGKPKDDAISFTLAVLMAIYVLQCFRHFELRIKRKAERKAKRKAKRARALTEKNINGPPVINHLSVTANSSEVAPIAENQNTVGAVNNVVLFDGKENR
jgi:hypothetical protein